MLADVRLNPDWGSALTAVFVVTELPMGAQKIFDSFLMCSSAKFSSLKVQQPPCEHSHLWEVLDAGRDDARLHAISEDSEIIETRSWRNREW
jgi:hypothetical protein